VPPPLLRICTACAAAASPSVKENVRRPASLSSLGGIRLSTTRDMDTVRVGRFASGAEMVMVAE
jgi:hypothetical protein